MKAPSLRLLSLIVKQYAANEACNAHTPNVTLLAEHFGTPYQKKAVKLFADVLEFLGYQTSDVDLRHKYESVRIGLEHSFHKACTEAGI